MSNAAHAFFFLLLLHSTVGPHEDVPQNGNQWATYCMYDRFPSGTAVPAAFKERFPCPAYYYKRVANPPADCAAEPAANASDHVISIWIQNCLTRVEVGSTEDVAVAPAGSNLLAERKKNLVGCVGAAGGDATALAKCNFANWYAFYRTRWRSLQTAMSRVVGSSLGTSVRVGYQDMQAEQITSTDAYFINQLQAPFSAFTDLPRQQFQNWLYATQAGTGTPLIESAVRVRNFYLGDRAYRSNPQAATSDTNKIRLCRNNFHLLFTDGAWDTPSASVYPWNTGTNQGNIDGTGWDLPQSDNPETAAGSAYGQLSYDIADASTRIYRDSNSKSLADVVFYSWVNDLSEDPNAAYAIKNISVAVNPLVADKSTKAGDTTAAAKNKTIFWNPKNDPADWLHLTTFTVGFGLQGKVTADTATTNNKVGLYSNGTKNLVDDGFPEWDSSTVPSEKDKFDDLWHAGINGRGGYGAANNPAVLERTFKAVMDRVSSAVTQTGSATAAPTVNSGSTGTSRMVFQATLETGTWSGDLLAYRVSDGMATTGTCSGKPKGDLCEDPGTGYYWSAAALLNPDPIASDQAQESTKWQQRVILTSTAAAAAGVTFDPASLTDANRDALLTEVPGSGNLLTAEKVAAVTAIMNYIKGDQSKEQSAANPDNPYRKRESLLGDIINGAPVVVGAPHRAYYESALEPGYPAFREAQNARSDLVYVGANDGMLHAFYTGGGTGVGGRELFAYVPRPLFPTLQRLTNSGYGGVPKHTSYVDGPIAEGDVYANGWKSVVVGTLGMGAQGVYALRSPDSAADLSTPAGIHLWDFTDQEDADMGYVLGKPTIARVQGSDGKPRWVAIFGNGVNSSEDDGTRAQSCASGNSGQDQGTTSCGQAVLYVVDMKLDNGQVKYAKFTTGAGRLADPRTQGLSSNTPKEPNGLSQPTALGQMMAVGQSGSTENLLIATVAYAGDLFGNLWRFDLTNLDYGKTKTATLVFKAHAQGDATAAQPITSPVVLAQHPTGIGLMVLFGTGRFLGGDDRSNTSVQSFYGIWDRVADGSTTGIGASFIQPQYFKNNNGADFAVTSGTSTGTTASYGRTSTRVDITWSAHPTSPLSGEVMGWRIDLGTSAADAATVDQHAAAKEPNTGITGGERVVVAPQVRGERVVFVSLVPESDECIGGGYGWVNALAYASGSALNDTPFDYNRDGIFDTNDLLAATGATAEAGSSIRLSNGGIYSATAALPVGTGSKILASDSKGKLVELLESSALQWRVWRQVQ